MDPKSYYDLSVSFEDYLKRFEAEYNAGPDNNAYFNYVKLNWSRSKRIVKTTSLLSLFSPIKRNVAALAINEHWCGDAAQNLPVIHRICQESEIDFGVVYRDENPDLIENYLTNGAKSIPKVVFFDRDTGAELFVWGPRPEPAQHMVMDNKHTKELSAEALAIKLQQWYNADNSQTLQKELAKALGTIQ